MRRRFGFRVMGGETFERGTETGTYIKRTKEKNKIGHTPHKQQHPPQRPLLPLLCTYCTGPSCVGSGAMVCRRGPGCGAVFLFCISLSRSISMQSEFFPPVVYSWSSPVKDRRGSATTRQWGHVPQGSLPGPRKRHPRIHQRETTRKAIINTKQTLFQLQMTPHLLHCSHGNGRARGATTARLCGCPHAPAPHKKINANREIECFSDIPLMRTKRSFLVSSLPRSRKKQMSNKPSV